MVVVQSDFFSQTNTVTICPLTTVERDAEMLRVPIRKGDGTGLVEDSYVQIDKVNTVWRSKLGSRVGAVDRATMLSVERSIAVFLGFGTTKDR